MNNLFAREPLFSIEKKLYAYQFTYFEQHEGAFPLDVSSFSSNNELNPVLNIDELMQVGKTIINLPVANIGQFSDLFSHEEIIVEFTGLTSAPNDKLLKEIRALKKQGCELIVLQHQSQWKQFGELANYVKCDLNQTTPHDIKQLQATLTDTNIKIIASQVHTQFQFEQCKAIGIDYIQGFFFLEYCEQKGKAIPANKAAYLQLMMEIAKPELDISQLQYIFERDPTLSFLLMKFINNPLVNKSFKITSIRHALNFLGELMVKRFVAIVSLAGLNADKPNELLNLSLSRAKYCELVDSDSIDAMSAFLVGMFSLLDIILDRPLATLLKELELDDKIECALIDKKGRFSDILSSAKALESGDWKSLISISNKLSISKEVLFQKHRQSVSWQNDMTSATSKMFPVTKPS